MLHTILNIRYSNGNTLLKSLNLLIGLLLLSSCGASAHYRSDNAKRGKEVTILAVNDIHASIDRMARLAFVADSLRNVYPDLLLVSAGDNQTGNPANDMYDPIGYPMIDLMNSIGFAVSAVGNHEFDSGVKGFEHLTHVAQFPFISANTVPPHESDLNLKPYHIIQLKNGTRVGFISVVEVSPLTGTPASHPDKMKGFQFLEPLNQALKYDSLGDSVDFPIFLTHIGYATDRELAMRLDAHRYPLIIGGHSHTLVPDQTFVNGVHLTQAKSNLKYATLIHIKKSSTGAYSVTSHNLPIDPNAGSVDPAVSQKVDRYLNNKSLMEVVGSLTAPLKNKAEIGYLFTDALRDASGSDFALANGGGIRIPNLQAGDVRVKDIYAADPFGNEAVIYKLTEDQIIDLLTKHYVGDGYKICFPSGLYIDYHIPHQGTDENAVEIRIRDTEGKPLDSKKLYTVAMNNYLSTTFLDDSLNFKSMYTTTAEITIKYLKKLSTIPSYENEKRIQVDTLLMSK